MSTKIAASVSSFIISNVNPIYLEALNRLSSLKYPIDDLATFEKLVSSNNEEGKEVETLIKENIGPKDMPLMNQQSAFEKFSENISRFIPTMPTIPMPGSGPVAFGDPDCYEWAVKKADEVAERYTRLWYVTLFHWILWCMDHQPQSYRPYKPAQP